MGNMYFVSLVLCFLAIMGLTWADYAPDEVTELPGMGFKPNFRQWSGHLKASPGKFLHYWFVTSQRDPLTDPVVLWLNGGPGCSSLDGLLSENGPFHVNDDGETLYENKFSWNRIANVLYLESPAGVGYSYSDDQKYKTDDDQVADDNYLALQSFFTKFPNFTQNEFFIIGESYGGIYAPTLSQRVATGTAKINFKGFAVGNGLSSYALNDQSLIYFGYYHGLFGEQLWTDLNTNCCNNGICNFFNNSKEDCKRLVKSSAGRAPVGEVPPCINSTAQINWLNRGDVRKALHIPDTLPPWDICSDVVGEQYTNLYPSVKDVYLKLLSIGVRALVYNGDTDMACNFLGDKWFVEQLNQTVSVPYPQSYQTWISDNQIAGFYEQYGNITFLTIKVSTTLFRNCNCSVINTQDVLGTFE
uniref:Carboxypeptidase n=1 Tax=Esox lucius TaxID=8010 RepID=A0AAY5KWF7_ESOLU